MLRCIPSRSNNYIGMRSTVSVFIQTTFYNTKLMLYSACHLTYHLRLVHSLERRPSAPSTACHIYFKPIRLDNDTIRICFKFFNYVNFDEHFITIMNIYKYLLSGHYLSNNLSKLSIFFFNHNFNLKQCLKLSN